MFGPVSGINRGRFDDRPNVGRQVQSGASNQQAEEDGCDQERDVSVIWVVAGKEKGRRQREREMERKYGVSGRG